MISVTTSSTAVWAIGHSL